MTDTSVLQLELQMPDGRVVTLEVDLNDPEKRQTLAASLESAGNPAVAELLRQAVGSEPAE